MKTHIILPYKDRFEKYKKALDEFLEPFIGYINIQLKNYEIIIVEQQNGLKSPDNSEDLFNLGRTVNCGFDIFIKKYNMSDQDIFYFQPVDCIPVDTDYNINKTTWFSCIEHSPTGEYPKILGFTVKDFKKLNGFSNNFWGWGLEDEDMAVRLKQKQIEFDKKINKYKVLASHGNGRENEPAYHPLKQYNYRYIGNPCEYSGLNNLDYKIISEEIYKNIKKYTIE
jgi:beta-1,4-galactosyltransferase 1